MLSRLALIVTALFASSFTLAEAQQPTANPPPLSAPSVQGAQVPGGNQPKSTQDQGAPTGKTPILKPSQPPQNEESSREGAQAKNGVGAVEHKSSDTDDRLVNLTFWLVVATGVLMAATVLLWLETRKLAKQAVEASKDTKRSIEIAEGARKETARAAQAAVDALTFERAWLTYSDVFRATGTNVKGRDGKQYDRGLGFSVNWINSGRSPAIKSGTLAAHSLVPFNGIPGKFNLSVPKDKRNANFGPGQGAGTPMIWIYGAELDKFMKQISTLIIYAYAEYSITSDPDGTYKSEACIAINFNGETRDGAGRIVPNLEMHTVGQQNQST